MKINNKILIFKDISCYLIDSFFGTVFKFADVFCFTDFLSGFLFRFRGRVRVGVGGGFRLRVWVWATVRAR